MAKPLHEWWRHAAGENYWLEITDRSDIGADLKAPQLQDDGTEFWGYSLVTRTNHGDVVFHYNKRVHAITAWSLIAGGWWEDEIVWAAHGTSARGTNTKPYPRPGWKVGLTDYQVLADPLPLDDIVLRVDEVLEVESTLRATFGLPLYLAFSRYGAGLRPQQGYLAKLPQAIVAMFPQLAEAEKRAVAISESLPTQISHNRKVGTAYREADENVAVSDRDPMFPDPALIEGNYSGRRVGN